MQIPADTTFPNKTDATDVLDEITTWLGSNDPTTRRMLEEILAMEEQYASDLLGIIEHLPTT